MRANREWLRVGMMMGVLLAGISTAGWGQTTSTGRASSTPVGRSSTDPMADGKTPDVPAAISEKMAMARNDERQKKLQADTTQLLALATKLKEDVDKTDKYTLSLDVLKRTAEIEKLAKSIRDRMKE